MFECLNILRFERRIEPSIVRRFQRPNVRRFNRLSVRKTRFIKLDPMTRSSYTLWVRNAALDQPMQTSGLAVSFYSSTGLVKVVRPPPVRNITGPIWGPTPVPTVSNKCGPRPTTLQPTRHPTPVPTLVPTPSPTSIPTLAPSAAPTGLPSLLPTLSVVPSQRPTLLPSLLPTSAPSSAPSLTPTNLPSSLPTFQPTMLPMGMPSTLPTLGPTSAPTLEPTLLPTQSVLVVTKPQAVVFGCNDTVIIEWKLYGLASNTICTAVNIYLYDSQGTFLSILATSYSAAGGSYSWTRPISYCGSTMKVRVQCSTSVGYAAYSSDFIIADVPTLLPTLLPTTVPTLLPTTFPSLLPTSQPSSTPTLRPSGYPTLEPSSSPTLMPSLSPSSLPSLLPIPRPSLSFQPTMIPTQEPTRVPTINPTALPTIAPTLGPSFLPSALPSAAPTLDPTLQPTPQPSISPEPTKTPSSKPTSMPTPAPTLIPSSVPSFRPSALPTSIPTLEPTPLPTTEPTPLPTFDRWCIKERTSGEAECTYHDQPLSGNYTMDKEWGDLRNVGILPVWAIKQNRWRSEFLRVACFDLDEVSGKLLLRECQRYMSAEAFGHVHRAATCPPVDDACGPENDKKWYCSSAVPGGIYQCPERASTMIFCPNRSPCVQPEIDVTTRSIEKVKKLMCTAGGKDFDLLE